MDYFIRLQKYATYIFILIFAIGLFHSCTKEQEPIPLDIDYLTVADVLQYCQGSCDQTHDWEGASLWVTGHILNFSNDSIRSDYYSQSRFFLQDIRNGMFIDIRIEDNKDPIFEKIWPANHKNKFYIRGTAGVVIITTNDECTKGVVIFLTHPDQINFE